MADLSLNVLDRVVMSLSPARGVARIEARARASILMNYDAASTGRRLKAWKSPATDADAASGRGRTIMRNRARDIIRNAPFARRAQMVVTNNVVASGIAPSITGASKSARARAAKVILPFLASKEFDRHGVLNFSAMQTVACNSVFESGEVLAVRRFEGAARPRPLGFSVELLEIDHLNSSLTSFDGNEVIDGIEYDADGVAIFYHIYEKHPGGASRFRNLKSIRTPASEVIHVRRIDRPGQMRGVPWLAPVMVTLGDLRDYQEAQNLKQKISSLMVGIIETDDVKPQGAAGLSEMSPGGFAYVDQGQKVTFSTPPPAGDFDPVMRLGLQAIAMGVGITTESLTGDLSRVNFSSMRGGRLEMDKNIETWQEQVIIGQLCEGVARWTLDGYRISEGARVTRGLGIGWTAPRRALIDPTKEIPAILKKVEGGLTSLSREQRAMGLDPDTVARERQEDAARAAPVDPPPALPDPEKGNAK